MLKARKQENINKKIKKESFNLLNILPFIAQF